MGQLKLVEVKEIREGNRNLVLERAGLYGVDSLLDFEAISILTGIKDVELRKVQTLRELKEQYKMLKMTKAQRIKLEAFFEMAIRFNKESRGEIKKITGPEDVYDLLSDMKHLKKEEFRIVILDTKYQVIKIETISVGSLNASIVHPREVFKEAVLNSASAIILAHNHPSLNSKPSSEDINITKRLVEAGQLMGIAVLDHVIIGERYTSLKEDGFI